LSVLEQSLSPNTSVEDSINQFVGTIQLAVNDTLSTYLPYDPIGINITISNLIDKFRQQLAVDIQTENFSGASNVISDIAAEVFYSIEETYGFKESENSDGLSQSAALLIVSVSVHYDFLI
jgi:hypothetical protein